MIKNTVHLHVISTLLFAIRLIQFFQQFHKACVLTSRFMRKPDKLLTRIIFLKYFQRNLKNNRLIRQRRIYFMNLIRIHDHKFSLCQMPGLLIDFKFQFSATHRKDLNRSVPVLFSVVMSFSAFKQKQFKRKSRFRNDQFMCKLHLSYSPYLKLSSMCAPYLFPGCTAPLYLHRLTVYRHIPVFHRR